MIIILKLSSFHVNKRWTFFSIWQFDNITAEVTKNTEAIQTGKSELTDLRRQKQSLEIDLQALHNMVLNVLL